MLRLAVSLIPRYIGSVNAEKEKQKQKIHMKKTIKTLALGLAAVALMSATSVQASWSSFWYESFGPPGVDKVTATISGGGTFNTPGLEAEEFSGSWLAPLPGWTSANAGNTATMSNLGNPVISANLFYWINVSSDISQPFQIVQQDWNGATLLDTVILTYDGTGASNVDPLQGDLAGNNPENRAWNNFGFRNDLPLAPVPEPTTMIAGALLLLPFGASVLRKLRKTA